MPRLMSVALTEQAVRDRTKTVTRRLGWLHAEPGMQLDLCRKVMGRRHGEPLVKIARVELVDVRRERLDAITDADVLREGFTSDDLAGWADFDPNENLPGDFAAAFVAYFAEHMRCAPETVVTRLEWRYAAQLLEV